MLKPVQEVIKNQEKMQALTPGQEVQCNGKLFRVIGPARKFYSRYNPHGSVGTVMLPVQEVPAPKDGSTWELSDWSDFNW